MKKVRKSSGWVEAWDMQCQLVESGRNFGRADIPPLG